MATSPASAGSPGVPGSKRRGRAAPGRRISRWVIRVLLLAVASFSLATPAFAATQATHQTQAGQETQAGHQTRSVHNDRTGRVAATPATLLPISDVMSEHCRPCAAQNCPATP